MCSSPDKLSVHWDKGRNSKWAPIHHGRPLKVTYTSLQCGSSSLPLLCPGIGILAGTLHGLRYTMAKR
ncbi:hypothetical protein DPMN_127245 [Dreissena polymorpha]|uniref:Uncharacterized protein n=1 Tax=Dreissena polymorpha TaxID=45954 RepID=A0A9D4GYM6_DREPO|nr:hypothetical protein DPMN_127245 [Dreissena polymorpha]